MVNNKKTGLQPVFLFSPHSYFNFDIPPSTDRICPVIQEESVERRNMAAADISFVFPTRASGCLLAEASNFSGVFNNPEASGVCVRDGATTFTRIPEGANSDASERHSPSSADFEAATLA
jgi:hypothetical protein